MGPALRVTIEVADRDAPPRLAKPSAGGGRRSSAGPGNPISAPLCRQLAASLATVDIALDFGFRELSSFSIAFRKLLRRTPTGYRRSLPPSKA
jgi:AraC-like DNA-binding protein